MKFTFTEGAMKIDGVIGDIVYTEDFKKIEWAIKAYLYIFYPLLKMSDDNIYIYLHMQSESSRISTLWVLETWPRR